MDDIWPKIFTKEFFVINVVFALALSILANALTPPTQREGARLLQWFRTNYLSGWTVLAILALQGYAFFATQQTFVAHGVSVLGASWVVLDNYQGLRQAELNHASSLNFALRFGTLCYLSAGPLPHVLFLFQQAGYLSVIQILLTVPVVFLITAYIQQRRRT